jgi:hypothetical protein
MSNQVPPGSGDNATVLRGTAGGSWWFAILTAVFAFALVRGYLGAATTAGRIGTIFLMGLAICFCAWAAIFMVAHRPTMSISAGAITYAKAATSARSRAAGPETLVLDRSSGNSLSVVTKTRIVVRGSRKYRKNTIGLTIPGSGITLPMASFGVNRVERACVANGWQFHDERSPAGR